MSIAIMSWVFYEERSTQGAERLVLLALADQANDEGYTWPGQARLARKANIDKSSLPDIQRRLIERLLLTVQRRKDHETGRDLSNMYRIVWTEAIKREEQLAGTLGIIPPPPPGQGGRVAAGNPPKCGGEGCRGQPGRVAVDNPEGGPEQPESLINPQSNLEEKRLAQQILFSLVSMQGWYPVTCRLVMAAINPSWNGDTLILEMIDGKRTDQEIKRKVYGLAPMVSMLYGVCLGLNLEVPSDLGIRVIE